MFLVSRGELEGRIDAIYYAEKPNTNEFVKIGSFVNIKGGKRIPKEMGYSEIETDFLYLRVDDIGNFGNIKIDTLKYLPQEVFNILEHYELNPNEVVISIAGTIGKITLLRENQNKRIILTENAAKLIIKTEEILPEYLKILLELPIVQKQMQLAYIQTTIPKLALERIANLKVPKIPPLEIQQQIVDKMEAAYTSKRTKEAEAAQLLASIDGYLLEQLGITLPESTPKKKTFFVNLDKVSGRRFDPFYHQDEFIELEKAMSKGKYEMVKLKEIFVSIKKGVEVGSNAYIDNDESIPFIRVSDITNVGLNYKDAAKKISTSLYSELAKDFQPQVNEILYSKDGTIGFCCYLDKVENCIISSGILRLLVDNEVNYPLFISYLLSTNILKKISDRVAIGAVIKHLTIELWLNLSIPLPPLAVQHEIAAHITAIRTQAQALEAEAKEVIALAKQEVEAMILGEGGSGV